MDADDDAGERYRIRNRVRLHRASGPDLFGSVSAKGGDELATLIGESLLWLLGNEDALKLLGSFTLGLGLIYTILASWKYIEGGRT